MRRRLPRTLVIAVLLGAVTTVLVTAWGVYRVSTRNNRVVTVLWSDGATTYFIEKYARPGKAMATRAPVPPRSGQASAPPGMRPPGCAPLGDPTIEAALAANSASTRCDMAHGWPLLAFRGGFVVTARPTGAYGFVHDFGPKLDEIWATENNAQAAEPRTMPLVPIPLGAVVNTAVYGAAWWVLLFAPGAVRRQLRGRRGACLWCGYDRRGIAAEAVCPECGASVGSRGTGEGTP